MIVVVVVVLVGKYLSCSSAVSSHWIPMSTTEKHTTINHTPSSTTTSRIANVTNNSVSKSPIQSVQLELELEKEMPIVLNHVTTYSKTVLLLALLVLSI